MTKTDKMCNKVEKGRKFTKNHRNRDKTVDFVWRTLWKVCKTLCGTSIGGTWSEGEHAPSRTGMKKL